MRKKPKSVVIDVTDYRVIDEPERREPVIKSWGRLWWFLIPPSAIFAVRYAQIIGWL